MESVERWQESLSERQQAEPAAAVSLLGAGLIAGAIALAKRRRTFLSLAIPSFLISLGTALLIDTFLKARKRRIEEAEQHIAEQLAALDPVARAEVLKRVGEQQIGELLKR